MDNISKIYESINNLSEYSFTNLKDPKIKAQHLELQADTFAPHVGGDRDFVKYLVGEADDDHSIAVLHKGKVVGSYALRSFNPEETNSDIEGKRGMEGIGLALHKDHRGKGIGNKLKDMSENIAKNSGHDFIWGQHIKSLNNLDDWLKRRKLLHTNEYIHSTYKMVK